jgi:hypothetical protein
MVTVEVYVVVKRGLTFNNAVQSLQLCEDCTASVVDKLMASA